MDLVKVIDHYNIIDTCISLLLLGGIAKSLFIVLVLIFVIKYEVIIYFIRATDSELKLWSTETGQCLRTFRGHVNEKNFVGLTVNNGYLSCGEFILTCNINV